MRAAGHLALAATLALPATLLGAKVPEPAEPLVKIVLVQGDRDWTDTGIFLRLEDRLTIRAGAVVCFSAGERDSCVRSAGWDRASYEARWPRDHAACADPHPEWNHAALLVELGGEVQPVGQQFELIGREGALRLGINDCSLSGDLHNEGAFSVVVTIEDPPAQAARRGRELIAAAIDALGGREALDAVKSLTVRAACSGPEGSFTTEVFSLRPTRTLMRQSFGEERVELLVIGEQAWSVDREKGKRKKEPPRTREMVRGHEFQLIPFELDSRFRHHTFAGVDESGCARIEMADAANAPAALCLDPESHLPLRLSHQPAGRPKGETIHLELESWRRIDAVLYLEQLTLRQGEETITCRYESIEPNSVDSKLFRVEKKP